MKTRELTCIVCPRGCGLTVTLGDDGAVLGVAGNACPRGKTYADAECTHPTRTVTSTVKCEGGGIVAVKTTAPIPKECIFDVMREINAMRAPHSIQIGDIVIKDILSLGADIVATSMRID